MPEGRKPADRAVGEDRLLDGRVRLLQPLEGYRAAIDPVLLAAATAAEPGEAVSGRRCCASPCAAPACP
jgi:hypothetical protein